MAERFKEWTEDIQVAGGDLNRTMRGLFEDMTVSRIVVRRPNGTKLFELPAVAGLAAGVLLWQFSLVAVGVARLANYRIHVVRRQTVPAEEDLEVVIEEIVDDTSWPDEPTEDIPIMDSADKLNIETEKSEPMVGIQVEDFNIVFEDDDDHDEDESIAVEEVSIVDDVVDGVSNTAETVTEKVKDVVETVSVAVESPAPVASTGVTEVDGDDFSRIRWIGPTYENLLKTAGITSYGALANAEPDALRAIFEEANIAPPDVNTWREQAEALMQSA